MVMGDLTAKVGTDNTLVWHDLGTHSFADYDNNARGTEHLKSSWEN